MCYYSADHPLAFFDHDVRLSPWISPADVKRRGAVVIWKLKAPRPRYLKNYPGYLRLPDVEYDRAVPMWIQRLFGRRPAPARVHAAIIPPAP